ncbi:MAG: hypothetical protein FWF85_00540 [Clostridiales bacterium]|jgi:hypothetical protein|nr:hypothetical protein [Clostridiales bacterium]MDR2712647.1 hypothetical protein [Clostridiales bacterium]
MSDNISVFDDIMQALSEVEEHQKGNIQLKSTFVERPDDDIGSMFEQLEEGDKHLVIGMVKRLLVAGSR